jgi:hypothetical protein
MTLALASLLPDLLLALLLLLAPALVQSLDLDLLLTLSLAPVLSLALVLPLVLSMALVPSVALHSLLPLALTMASVPMSVRLQVLLQLLLLRLASCLHLRALRSILLSFRQLQPLLLFLA